MTELQWKCDVCKNVIGDDWAGWLYITQEEVDRAYEVDKAWHEFNESTNGKSFTLDDLSRMPDRAKWSVGCQQCFEAGKLIEVNSYDIEVSRIATYKDALDWTLHLMEKEWLHRSDWDNRIREASKVALDA